MKFSMFKCLKVASSFLWSLFIVECVMFYIYPAIRSHEFYSSVLATWAMIVVVVLEEIYYMIEEKVII